MAFKKIIKTVASSVSSAFPDGLFTGLRAMTTQSFTEANIKNGLQFYLRQSWPLGDTFASGETKYIYIETGSKKVIVKNRIVKYTGEEFSLSVYTSPVVTTQGTAINIRNYNTVNPVATTLTAYAEPVLSDVGTLAIDPEYYFGEDGFFFTSSDSIPEDEERVLNENTVFVIAITNNGGAASRFEYFIDWYEGEPDLPL